MATRKEVPRSKKPTRGTEEARKSLDKANPETIEGGVDEREIARRNRRPRSARQSLRGTKGSRKK